MRRNSKKKKSSINRVKADKTSKKAFKITSKVKTSTLQTLMEVRAGTHVKIS